MKLRNTHFSPDKAHHRRNGFRNPAGSPSMPRISTEMAREAAHFMAQMRQLANGPAPFPPGHALTEEQAISQYQQMQASHRLTWLGHASFLVTLNGLRILTDPFLSPYASPLPLKVTRRIIPAAIGADQLSALDLIVVSHNHYDHLDSVSLKTLSRANPNARAIVPLGLKPLLEKCGFNRITELDWYQSTEQQGVTIQALPAVHTSKRGIGDTNRTLWCGYRIADRQKSVYFAGDTAYGEVFREIGHRAGPFDLGLVPIGAYQPRSLMKSVHCNPEEALQIGNDINAAHLVGMHWGTIRLTTEPLLEPRDRFINNDSLQSRQVMKIGETIAF